MRMLPVEALALEPDVTAWLRALGLSACGDLQKLPRRSLGTRLGARAHDVMQLLDGQDPTPLAAWRPPVFATAESARGALRSTPLYRVVFFKSLISCASVMGTTVSAAPSHRQELCHAQPALSRGGDAHWDAHLTQRRGKLNGRIPGRPPGIE